MNKCCKSQLPLKNLVTQSFHLKAIKLLKNKNQQNNKKPLVYKTSNNKWTSKIKILVKTSINNNSLQNQVSINLKISNSYNSLIKLQIQNSKSNKLLTKLKLSKERILLILHN